jgi:hypothetical protein
MNEPWKRLLKRLEQWRCGHDAVGHHWRPALTSSDPCRTCMFCEKTEILSVEDFYAHFGRMPIL